MDAMIRSTKLLSPSEWDKLEDVLLEARSADLVACGHYDAASDERRIEFGFKLTFALQSGDDMASEKVKGRMIEAIKIMQEARTRINSL